MAKKYIEFRLINFPDGDKEWLVKTYKGASIARIEYYSRWKRWVLAPVFESVWTSECLQQIVDFLKEQENEI